MRALDTAFAARPLRSPVHVRHLNCISTCPFGGVDLDGRTESNVRRGRLICHCLLVECADGLLLVDAGLGLRAVHDPTSRLSQLLLHLVTPDFREQMTAVRQLEHLGYNPCDVRHIVLTNLDLDHASALEDFPNARVHALRREPIHDAAHETWLDRPQSKRSSWAASADWRLYDVDGGESWLGFTGVQRIANLDVLLVPLIGDAAGHSGVAVRCGDRWLLDVGDASCTQLDGVAGSARSSTAHRAAGWIMGKHRATRLNNQARVRGLLHAAYDRTIDVFCAHDVAAFERLSGGSAEIPAQHLCVRQTRRD